MTEETIKTIDTRAELASSFVGFMVHYVLPRGFHKGEIRPAIIVKAWSETCMQLQVFTDGINDVDPQDPQSTSYGSGMVWAASVPYSEDKSIVNTWHWPANLS